MLPAVLLGTSCQGLKVNTVARISSEKTAHVFVASDNEAMCSMLLVKDNRCGGWVASGDVAKQFSQSGCTSVPASFAWWLETRCTQPPSHHQNSASKQ